MTRGFGSDFDCSGNLKYAENGLFNKDRRVIGQITLTQTTMARIAADIPHVIH